MVKKTMPESLTFPIAEFEARVKRAQALIEEQGIDCLLVTDDRNLYYFTGFEGGVQRARPRPALIPRQGSPVVFIAPNYEICMREMTWIDDIRIYAIMTQAPTTEILTTIREFPLTNKRIGAELGYEQRLGVTYMDIERMKRDAPDLEIIDAADIFWRLRMIKSPLEIECLRRAVEITDSAYPRAFAQVKEGMSEKEISDLFARTLKECGAHSGSAYVVTGKGDYFRRMGTPRHRPVQQGEMVWVDMSAAYNGYHSDFSRAGVIGKPTPDQVDLQAKIHEVTMLGVEAVRPGRTVSDVACLLDREMEKRGLTFNSGAIRYGHGIGLLTTEPPHVADYDETVMEPGMVLTIEPAMHTKFGRFNVEENVLVTEGGHECLSTAERTLRIL
jgi:Xaa-Pro aminopeptidase